MDKFGVLEKLSFILGQELSILFGKECASASLFMFICLFLRFIVVLLNISPGFPSGFIFAFPLIIQMMKTLFPFLEDNTPLLIVRIAETLLGRISASQLTVVIPAHFLGCIFATVVFYSIIPFVPNSVFDTIPNDSNELVVTGSYELLAVCLYVTLHLILPVLLTVNHMSPFFLSIATIPVLISCKEVTFNPAAMYALWYVHGSRANLRVEHLLGPMIGAALSGLICCKMTPDDPISYKRRNNSNDLGNFLESKKKWSVK